MTLLSHSYLHQTCILKKGAFTVVPGIKVQTIFSPEYAVENSKKYAGSDFYEIWLEQNIKKEL